MRGKIILEAKYDRDLERRILARLNQSDVDHHTLLELSRALGERYKEGSKGWNQLRLHLIDMARRGLIEERHFGSNAGDWNGIVDYVIEPKGSAILHKDS